ncbi:hypothetical protein SBOR_6123 [Sclerotinia borealis F-4128]|uniref:Uncharacterized protein n=1 Tax=Sclerotinia borealis (strain F-4128) TaxID=1432307 RepID=W9CFD5_SCLBF|nr:hypothetical protein SBOR_6123 [Sclerotinia borealis F-4128]
MYVVSLLSNPAEQENWPDAHLDKTFAHSFVSERDSIDDRVDRISRKVGKCESTVTSVCYLDMDVEKLKQDPMRFLGLLYNRTKHSPEQWANMTIRCLKNTGIWVLWPSTTTPITS